MTPVPEIFFVFARRRTRLERAAARLKDTDFAAIGTLLALLLLSKVPDAGYAGGLIAGLILAPALAAIRAFWISSTDEDVFVRFTAADFKPGKKPTRPSGPDAVPVASSSPTPVEN